MNFRGHLAGGIAAGAAAAGIAHLAGPMGLNDLPAMSGAEFGGAVSHSALYVAGCFVTGLGMALFPDLDTGSVPQKWYLRIMFAALAASLLLGRMDLFAVLAFGALLPMIHKHRGWTHWKITPWIVALILAAVHEHVDTQRSWFATYSWEDVWTTLLDYWPYVFACVLGHYTHLLLDSRTVKWLPFISNPPNHH